MYPTIFKIPFLPDWLADIKSYGLMMMIAFLTGIWLACRRAIRSQANPDIVLNMGFIALIAGVAGARAMFVLHYWDSRFANQPNPWLAVFDIRAGGLEFWGGPLLVVPCLIIYLRFIARASVRWYLDITAPSLAWGLAITRIGCFLNGCCWGATCVDPHDPARQRAAVPWAVRFPYGSPAMAQQYRFGQLTLPKELLYAGPTGEYVPLTREFIEAGLHDDGRTGRQLAQRCEDLTGELAARRQSNADPRTTELIEAELARARAERRKHEQGGTVLGLIDNQCRKYGLTPRELAELASHHRSRPVHPAQLFETVTALIIFWFLDRLFYFRRRHGIVLPWFLMLYSVARVVLESIRQDNPLDVAGITISQAISLATFTLGLVWLAWLHRRAPLVSPRAAPFVFPGEDAPIARKASA